LHSINRIKDNHDLKEELEQLKVELGQKYEIQKIALGESNSIKKIYALIEKASKSNINVALSGESGTGKRLFARAIHFNSVRSNKPFISVDISAIPKDLVDLELFGQETTNASGYVSSKMGKIEQANGGTLFLQNISDLEMNTQAKLLYFLEEKYFYKVGGEKLITSDVRFVCSSSKDLIEEVRAKNLREDLFYALMRMPITLPPLRERGSDIIILAKHILNQYCIENNLEPKVLSSAACEKLLAYPFPGNIHELKSIIQFALVMSNAEQIEVSDLMFTKIINEINLFPEEKTMREYTISIVQSFLRRYDGNVLKVAEKLDIGKSTIYKMIQEKEIVP
jgi:DNA-binding NtrC family response regulator